MVTTKPRLPVVVTATTAILVFLFFVLHPGRAKTSFLSFGHSSIKAPGASTSKNTDDELPYGWGYRGHSDPADVNRVTNGTLGFGKVFVIGLPERSDKRDALALASSLTGFNVEWIDGVRGESIPDKAVPFGIDRKVLMETNLGSWRGHMNAVRRIIEDDLDSALIMEDDLDWDVHLKPQLELIASGTRAIESSLPNALYPGGRPSSTTTTKTQRDTNTPLSPYGDDWDILWLGHCGELFPEDLPENQPLPDADPAFTAMARKWTILDDLTVPTPDHVTGLVDFGAYPPHTRWVHVTAAPICTFAYALSRRGAQKVLYDLSVDKLAGPFDNALAGLCRRAVGSWSGMLKKEEEQGDRGLDVKCMSVTPPLFFHHKAKGPVSADSDIQSYGDELREKGSTENIVWSARLNLRNMIIGKEVERQW